MLSRTLVFFALALPATALPFLPAAALAAPEANRLVRGHVEDPAGNPVAHVFVHQPGGLAAAFTDARGDFSLGIDPDAPAVLLASGPGMISARIPLADAGTPIIMTTAPQVAPPARLPPLVPVTPEPARALDSGFALRSDWRSSNYVGQGGNSVSGAVDGEVGIDLTLRQHQENCQRGWIVQLDALRNRPAVTVPSLAGAMAPEALEGTLALGYLFHPVHLSTSIGPYLVGYGRSISSFANGAQYTGTPLDWNDSRWSAGLGGQIAGWLAPQWRLAGAARLEGYLLTSDHLSGGAVPAQISALHGAKGEVSLGWEFMPQIRLNVGYQHELWRGFNYAEDADTWTVGFGFYPGSARP